MLLLSSCITNDIDIVLSPVAKQESGLMKSWLGLVNERNGLVRKTSELSLRMKELELEDRQYEVDKKLNALTSLHGMYVHMCVCVCAEVCPSREIPAISVPDNSSVFV